LSGKRLTRLIGCVPYAQYRKRPVLEPDDREVDMKAHLFWRTVAAGAVCLATCVHTFAAEDPASPESRPRVGVRLALQGLFCNSAELIDQAVLQMRQGLSPRAAVELVNRDAVVCTFVDLLRYVVERPVVIHEIPGSVPLFAYEGMLVAVVVGRAIRPVTPPVHIYFAMPERLDDAPLEGGA
jgi:hypothetical protein